MEVGIGLPATVPGVEREQLLEWSRRADAAGFSSLGVIDRLVYPNLEPLLALAAAAAVTERIRLTTSILIAPLHPNAALLAKELATLDRLSGGRLVAGLAVGGREDDYAAGGVDFAGRGRAFERQLDELKQIWAGEERGYAGAVGPPATRREGPPILIGGQVDAAYERVCRYAEGWIAGGGGPALFAQGAEKARSAWRAHGREGEPRLAALAYFALGPTAKADADSYLHDYYGFLGEIADGIAAGAITDEAGLQEQLAAFAEAGCDELILFPSSTDPRQVDLLAAAAL